MVVKGKSCILYWVTYINSEKWTSHHVKMKCIAERGDTISG